MNPTGISVMSYLSCYCLMIVALILGIFYGVFGVAKAALPVAGDVIKSV